MLILVLNQRKVRVCFLPIFVPKILARKPALFIHETVVGNFEPHMKTFIYILIVFMFLGCKTKKHVSDETLDKYVKEIDELHSEYVKNSFKVEFYDNGFTKSIGKINPEFLTNAARIGLWSEFYENGKLKETGEYKTDSYVNCCIAGPCDI